jgi:hypothetical protein
MNGLEGIYFLTFKQNVCDILLLFCIIGDRRHHDKKQRTGSKNQGVNEQAERLRPSLCVEREGSI